MDLDKIFTDTETLKEALVQGFHVGNCMFMDSEGLQEVKTGDYFRVGPFVGTCLYNGTFVTVMRMEGQYKSWEEYHKVMGVLVDEDNDVDIKKI